MLICYTVTQLLEKVHFDKTYDHIVATGDVISKGPDSPGVVDLLISLNASAVRGNNEDRLLLFSKSAQHLAKQDTGDASFLPSQTRSKVSILLESLKHHHLDYLRSLPVILRIPPLTPASKPAPRLLDAGINSTSNKESSTTDNLLHKDIYVIHAGLVPGVPASRQDPYSVMNMRSIDPTTYVPSAKRDEGLPWEQVWNWYQKKVSKDHGKSFPEGTMNLDDQVPSGPVDDGKDHRYDTWPPRKSDADSSSSSSGSKGWFGESSGKKEKKVLKPAVAIYGHDSKRSLNLHPWSKGLDSGCVFGGSLTALVLDAWGRQEIVSVDCEKDMRQTK